MLVPQKLGLRLRLEADEEVADSRALPKRSQNIVAVFYCGQVYLRGTNLLRLQNDGVSMSNLRSVPRSIGIKGNSTLMGSSVC